MCVCIYVFLYVCVYVYLCMSLTKDLHNFPTTEKAGMSVTDVW